MDSALRLERDNAHPRDSRVVFYEKDHYYEIDGARVSMSVTAFVGQYFEHFDGLGTAKRCYWGWERPRDPETQRGRCGTLIKYLRLAEGLESPSAQREALLKLPWITEMDVERDFGRWQCDEDDKGYYNLIHYLKTTRTLEREAICQAIAGMWSKSGEKASTLGTALHRACEVHCNDPSHPELDLSSKEAGMYLRFRQDYPHWEPYRTEWSVFCKEADLSGQIDAIYRDTRTGEFVMVDYKRCKDPISPNNPWRKFGKPPFAQVPDTSFGHYSIQQSVYRWILDQLYGLHVTNCYLLQLHPNFDAYALVEVMDLRPQVHQEIMQRVRAHRAR